MKKKQTTTTTKNKKQDSHANAWEIYSYKKIKGKLANIAQ